MSKLFTKDELDEEIKKSVDAASLELPYAIGKLVEELQNDKEYYYAWQSNIAMAFHDEYVKEFGGSAKIVLLIHEIANNAAKRFLDSLCHQPVPQTNPI